MKNQLKSNLYGYQKLKRKASTSIALVAMLLFNFSVMGQGGGTNPVSCPGFSVAPLTIQNSACNPLNIPTNCYLTEVVSYDQGPSSNGGEIGVDRSNPAKALGAPQYDDSFNFFSLGFGGELVVKFGSPILNGPGNDVLLVETTFGNNQNCNSYRERAEVFASQDGVTFYSLGTTCLDGSFDLDLAVDANNASNPLPNAQFFKIVDRSNPADFGVGDAFDVDGMVCLNGSVGATPSGTGAITLNVTGGQAPFIYTWADNMGNTPSLSNLPGGTYTVTVTDVQNCTASTTVQVNQPAPLALSFTSTAVGCAGGNNGVITVGVTGGTPNYSYLWTSNQASASINAVGAGTYEVLVTDANGCQARGETTLGTANPNTNAFQLIRTKDESCLGANDGELELSINTFCYATPFTISWSNGDNGLIADGLTEGDYEVLITDANGGTDLFGPFPVKATSRITSSVVSTTDVKCFGGRDGSAVISASGCEPGYTYSALSTTPGSSPVVGTPNGAFNNLVAGTYNVTITNSNGITAANSFTINQPVRLQAGIVEGNCQLSATIIEGGVGPFSYSWARLQSTYTASGETIFPTVNGLYRVTVTDANGCTLAVTRNVQSLANCACNLSVLVSSTEKVKCKGGNDGSVSLSASGNFGSVSYSFSNNANPQALAAGSYSVTATDARGCSASTTFSISEIDELFATGSKSDIRCYGEDNGFVNLAPTGGTAPYTYAWPDGSTDASIFNLAPGNYVATVTDVNGCQALGFVDIAQPDSINPNGTGRGVRCNNDQNGFAQVAPTGGTAPYTYVWSNGEVTASIENLASAIYVVTITDANGCIKLQGFDVFNPDVMDIQGTVSDASCVNAQDGSIDASASGGFGTLSFLWSNGATSEDLSSLSAGQYTVTVTDLGGCEAIKTFTVGGSQPVRPNTACYEQATFDNSTCQWVVSGTQPVRPNTLCYQTATFNNSSCQWDVTGTSTLGASTNGFGPRCNNELSASASVVASGGTLPYSYLWSNGNATSSIANVAGGQYFVTITDGNGCTVFYEFNLDGPDALSLNVTKQNQQQVVNCNVVTSNVLGSANAAVSGGRLPYTYIWSNGAVTSSISSLTPGVYSVTVFDANQCSTTGSATVTLSTQNIPCTSGCNAVAFRNFKQGPGKIADVLVRRSDATKALGAAQNNNTVNFVSLGFGGSIELEFASPIADGPGNDLRIWETSYNRNTPNTVNTNSNQCTAYPERAQVFASFDGNSWVYLGVTCLDGEFDLNGTGLCAAKFIRIKDISNPLSFGNSLESDGFDIDAVECLNGTSTCVPNLTPCVARLASANQGPSNIVGRSILAARSNPNNGLVAQNNLSSFYALGFGGEIVVKFDYLIFEAPGVEFTVIEATSPGRTYDCPQFPEIAEVYGSVDGLSWTLLTTSCQDARVDLASSGLAFIQYVKVKDISNPSAFSRFRFVSDAYDVDGFVCGAGPWASIRSSASDEDMELDNELLLSINDEVVDKLETSVQPNPFSDKLSVYFNDAFVGKNVNLTIYNSIGQIVVSKEFTVEENTQDYSLANFADGTYFVKINSEFYNQSIKAVKVSK